MTLAPGFVRRFVVFMAAALILSACSESRAGAPPAQSEPAAMGTSAQQAEWNALVAAAQKEGKLTLRAGSVQEFRANLPRIFKDKFNVELEYISSSPAEFGSQVDRERAAGLYNLDVVLTGAAGMYQSAYPNKWLDPIPPVLIHPDALDG